MTRVALLAVLLVCTIPGRAGSACPTNGGSVWGPGVYHDFPLTGPTGSLGPVSYDLVVGTFAVTGGGGGGEQSGGASLGVSDIYQIVGPASVIPIPFQVVVHLAGTLSASLGTYPYIGTVCNNADTHFTLSSGPTSAAYQLGSYSPACTSVTVDHDVSIALQKLPGEAFTVANSLSVSGSASGTVNGTFAFVGLPPGYVVTSCQGYSSPPTPVSTRSWGSLKASYR